MKCLLVNKASVEANSWEPKKRMVFMKTTDGYDLKIGDYYYLENGTCLT